MHIESIIQYTAKSSVRTIVSVFDDNDELVDPTSILITITDPNGLVKVTAEEIITSGKIAEGIYDHYYNTAADSIKGWWHGIAEVIDGSGPTARTSMGNYSFEIT
ncbi:MAG: hypothetical protein ABSF21_00820 [Dehalococcoidia bacterium]